MMSFIWERESWLRGLQSQVLAETKISPTHGAVRDRAPAERRPHSSLLGLPMKEVDAQPLGCDRCPVRVERQMAPPMDRVYGVYSSCTQHRANSYPMQRPLPEE